MRIELELKLVVTDETPESSSDDDELPIQDQVVSGFGFQPTKPEVDIDRWGHGDEDRKR